MLLFLIPPRVALDRGGSEDSVRRPPDAFPGGPAPRSTTALGTVPYKAAGTSRTSSRCSAPISASASATRLPSTSAWAATLARVVTVPRIARSAADARASPRPSRASGRSAAAPSERAAATQRRAVAPSLKRHRGRRRGCAARATKVAALGASTAPRAAARRGTRRRVRRADGAERNAVRLAARGAARGPGRRSDRAGRAARGAARGAAAMARPW